MAISFPSFMPELNPIAPPDVPDFGGEFTKSVIQGYQAGQVLNGFAKSMDQLKLAALQQRYDQEQQSFPEELTQLREANKTAPVNRELAIAKQFLEPGTITNAATGPRIPIGNSPMAITERWAAPKGEGQVPADTRELNIPGYPGVGVSPSAAQDFELKKRADEDRRRYDFYNYQLANPKTGSAQQTTWTDEAGRPLLFDRAQRKYVRSDTGEVFTGVPRKQVASAKPQLVKDAVGRSFWSYPPSPTDPNGRIVPVLNENDEQLVQTSPEGKAVRDDFEKLRMGSNLVDNLYSEFQKVVANGNVGILEGNLAKGINFVTGGAYDPELQSYQDEAAGLLASLRGITGDDARFSDTDAKRLFGLLSEAAKDPKVAEQKFATIRNMIESREKILRDRLKKGASFGQEGATTEQKPKIIIRRKAQ